VSGLRKMPRRPLQTVPGVATSKCTSPSVVKFVVVLSRPWPSPSGCGRRGCVHEAGSSCLESR
jgi:hypothetical protein